MLMIPILSLHIPATATTQSTAVSNTDVEAQKTVHKKARKHKRAPVKGAIDRSGATRKGKASYYGHEFFGKKMANGKPMNPHSDIAASKSLPLGTKAKVTNLETGKSAVVDIQDRGPYVDGRIIDLTPKTAEHLDIKKEGVAPVEVKPLVVPPKDENVKSDSSNTVSAAPSTK